MYAISKAPKDPYEFAEEVIHYIAANHVSFFAGDYELEPAANAELHRLLRLLRISFRHIEEFNDSERALDLLADAIEAPEVRKFRHAICQVRAELDAVKLAQVFQSERVIDPDKSLIITSDQSEWVVRTLDELRVGVRQAGLDREHTRRVLSRIDAVEQEIYKEHGALDRVLYNTEKIAKTLGQAGKDAKPAVDRARELMQFWVKMSDEPKAIEDQSQMKQIEDQTDKE